MFSIIVAIGKNNEIGKNNKLLWHIPEDLKKFKEITQGKTVVMGRSTFESIGKPLPDRHNIVLTKDLKSFSNDCNEKLEIFDDFSKIVEKYKNSDEEIFIIGGAQIYKKSLELRIVEKLYISHINFSDNEADTYFPEIDYGIWEKVEEEKYAEWKFCVYKRQHKDIS